MKRAGIIVVLLGLASTVGASTAGSDGPIVASSILIGTWTGKLDLMLPLVAYDTDDCDAYDSCGVLRDVSFVDLEVASQMTVVPSGWGIRFEVQDTGDRAEVLTTWRFCTYEVDHGVASPCRMGRDPLAGTVDPDTAAVRLLLLQGVERPYRLTMWATGH